MAAFSVAALAARAVLVRCTLALASRTSFASCMTTSSRWSPIISARASFSCSVAALSRYIAPLLPAAFFLL